MPGLNLAYLTKVRVAFSPFSNVAACRYGNYWPSPRTEAALLRLFAGGRKQEPRVTSTRHIG